MDEEEEQEQTMKGNRKQWRKRKTTGEKERKYNSHQTSPG
jgi:hypothetical protein